MRQNYITWKIMWGKGFKHTWSRKAPPLLNHYTWFLLIIKWVKDHLKNFGRDHNQLINLISTNSNFGMCQNRNVYRIGWGCTKLFLSIVLDKLSCFALPCAYEFEALFLYANPKLWFMQVKSLYMNTFACFYLQTPLS